MPGLTKCQPLLIVLGARREGISIALLEVARSVQPSKSPEDKEEARVEKVPLSALAEEGGEVVAGEACCLEGTGGVLGEADSAVKMGEDREWSPERRALKTQWRQPYLPLCRGSASAV